MFTFTHPDECFMMFVTTTMDTCKVREDVIPMWLAVIMALAML